MIATMLLLENESHKISLSADKSQPVFKIITFFDQ